MPDPNTIGQIIGGSVGAALTAAIAVLHNRFKRETEKRPLYENGQREEIIRMIRRLSRTMNLVEDQMAEMQRDYDEERGERVRLVRRLEALEAKQRP